MLLTSDLLHTKQSCLSRVLISDTLLDTAKSSRSNRHAVSAAPVAGWPVFVIPLRTSCEKSYENRGTRINQSHIGGTCLLPANSWLPPPSTSRTNIPFPQTFDPHMYCWATNLWCYRHELLPEHFQSCSTLYVREVFYKATYEEGINASQMRQKLNAFTSIWKISLAIFTKKELLSEILPFLWTPSA